jgi:outer membrane protein, multidrug efflux system
MTIWGLSRHPTALDDPHTMETGPFLPMTRQTFIPLRIWRALKTIAVGLATMALLGPAGCVPFGTTRTALPVQDLPPAYTGDAVQGITPAHWWEAFNDAQLTGFVETALAENLTLKQWWARLAQARALAVVSGAARYPSLDVTAGTSSARQRTVNGRTRTETVNAFDLGLASRYEIDLWGRVRAETEAAVLAVSATREDLNAAATTLAAEIAVRWVRLIARGLQKSLLQRQLETNQTRLELVELRYRKSMTSALDVFQQRQVVEGVRARIPLADQAERLLAHELALLMGKMPGAVAPLERQDLVMPALPPAAGLPMDLLTQRPDVRAAALRLRADDRGVDAARADRLPSVRLTASAGYGAGTLDLLLDNWLLRLAGALTAPVFDGQRRQAEVARTRAVVEEDLADFRHTLLTAVKEVEDALVREDTLRRHIDGLAVQLDAARSALAEAGSQYRNGLNDYLPVLGALGSVQTLQQEMIDRKADLLVARVDLYRALGGTWTGGLTKAEGGR